MQNQPNAQTPQGGHQNVPDHRLDEIMNEVRKLRDENNQLRGQIDYMARPTQTETKQEESPFDPKVDQALNAKFQRMLEQAINPLKTQITQQIGYVVDRTDELSFKQTYGSDRFQKFHDKVDKLRDEYQRRGQYIPREEALRIVYFEETGKKAHPETQTPTEPAKPEYDPYFGAMVDPRTKLPVQTQQAQLDDYGNPIQPEYEQPAPQPQQYAQQQYQQQRPVQNPTQPTGYQTQGNQRHPYANPYGQPPQLPNQGLNDASPGQRDGNMRVALDLEASDDQLQAFERQFGEIPL